MLLKLAKTLVLVAVGVILLHSLPGVCAEASEISTANSLKQSDGCVADDGCCASSSFVQTAHDFSLDSLDVAQSAPTIIPLAPQANGFVEFYAAHANYLPRTLPELGKLTI